MPSSLAVSRFLSTPSARRATVCHIFAGKLKLNFYPRPPRGGRPSQFGKSTSSQSISIHALREEGDVQGAWNRRERVLISIHALREEGDLPLSGAANVVAIFLSTPSTRRATRLPGGLGRVPDISIHALREEGDKAGEPVTIPINDFYPRPPRGGRRILPCFFPPKIIFLSTPSARRATRIQRARNNR